MRYIFNMGELFYRDVDRMDFLVTYFSIVLRALCWIRMMKPERPKLNMQMPPRARTSRTSLEAGGEEPRPPAQEGRGSDRRRARARARARALSRKSSSLTFLHFQGRDYHHESA